ncbi:MAG: hypothetical protein ACRC1F_01590 [Metamycoplasmataceae bacterium]
MSYYSRNNVLLNIFTIENINAPEIGDISSIDPMVILSVVMMTFALIFPCLIWFLRNFLRIVLKKNYDFFNRSIKWILLVCLVLFVISIILIILAVQEII